MARIKLCASSGSWKILDEVICLLSLGVFGSLLIFVVCLSAFLSPLLLFKYWLLAVSLRGPFQLV
jgi:hypothetical protein